MATEPAPEMIGGRIEERSMLKAKRFNSFEEMDFKPGSYCPVKAEGRLGILITLPCGDNFMPDSIWSLENPDDENKITINPSIFCSPQKPCWHGFLRNGEFINA